MTLRRLDSAVEIPHLKPDNQDANSSTPPANQTQSRLLSLPPELQLVIWEYVVVSPTPLLLNCPCDSSYGGWTKEYYVDVERWEKGELHPPYQPAITRVCRSIRADALPTFYKLNTFQAGYCYETDMEIVVTWLKAIGQANREVMGGFHFYDGNARHDVNVPRDLKRVMRGEVVRGMGGRAESLYDGKACWHKVRFDEEGTEEWEGGVVWEMFEEDSH